MVAVAAAVFLERLFALPKYQAFLQLITCVNQGLQALVWKNCMVYSWSRLFLLLINRTHSTYTVHHVPRLSDNILPTMLSYYLLQVLPCITIVEYRSSSSFPGQRTANIIMPAVLESVIIVVTTGDEWQTVGQFADESTVYWDSFQITKYKVRRIRATIDTAVFG